MQKQEHDTAWALSVHLQRDRPARAPPGLSMHSMWHLGKSSGLRARLWRHSILALHWGEALLDLRPTISASTATHRLPVYRSTIRTSTDYYQSTRLKLCRCVRLPVVL